MFFNYEHLQFRYEPFPIGRAIPFLDESTYGDMVDNFPPIDIFESFQAMGKKGEKYTLSQKENPKTYGAFVQSSPVWREFHAWIKSDDFVYELLDTLKERNIDLGYRQASPICRLIKTAKSRFKGKGSSGRHVPLRARFEFSALPADGGCLPPHTDAPTKIATIIVSMLKEGEWNPAFGGGTDVNRAKDQSLSFNQVNHVAGFDDMEVIDTFDFTPNQGVIFVKTFNSWHSVRPMTGHGSDALRRTLTVNIERRA
jgi:hypothetical protein